MTTGAAKGDGVMSAVQNGSAMLPEAEFSDELVPGTKLLRGQYTIESFLNAGGFGVTYLARDSLQRLVVLKECFPSSMCCRTREVVRARNRSSQKEFETVVKLFGQEARRLSALEHPNIVGIHQVFEDNGTAYMALDFVRGRDLHDIIEDPRVKLTPKHVRSILKKLLAAVKYIHDNNVLHRDISPDNILLQANGNPVLIDFGAARGEASRASRALSQIHVVKDGYSPQEFYVQGADQGPWSDLYSLAATMYHLITGSAPPSSQERVAAIAAEKDDPYKPLINRARGYDEHFLMAIDQALAPFPRDRLQTADDWVAKIDTVKRQRQALAEAAKDMEIEASIHDLVASTNVEVEPGKSGERMHVQVSEYDRPARQRAAKKEKPITRILRRRLISRIFTRKPPGDMDPGHETNHV